MISKVSKIVQIAQNHCKTRRTIGYGVDSEKSTKKAGAFGYPRKNQKGFRKWSGIHAKSKESTLKFREPKFMRQVIKEKSELSVIFISFLVRALTDHCFPGKLSAIIVWFVIFYVAANSKRKHKRLKGRMYEYNSGVFESR